MTEKRLCPKCGTEMSAEAAQGLCPKCLLNIGLESQAAVAETSRPVVPSEPRTATTIPPADHAAGRFPTPQVEAMARQFPQLEVLGLLGRGGMGVVYKARQRRLNRLVAVKILPPRVGDESAFAERFAREAQALARLNHPNIVQVYDFGQTDEFFYFVMEYVDGVNLRALMKDGTLKPEEALRIVPQICEALQFAHDEGIVHRDIKPENILIDKKGRVKIADFGLAKLLDRSAEDLSLTGTGQLMGTLGYMAPEQLQQSNSVDHRADIYSLGVVFYEMLTRQLPIGRFEPPSKKVHVDVRLDDVVLRALESEPDRRYQHAGDVKTDLESMTSAASRSLRNEVNEQTQGERRRGLGASIAEHPLLWTVAVVFSLPLLFALVGLAESVIASREWSNPNPSMGGPYPSMSGAIKPYAMLIVLFAPLAFLAWAYLWRASHRVAERVAEKSGRSAIPADQVRIPAIGHFHGNAMSGPLVISRKAETGEQGKFTLPRRHVLAWSIVGVVAFIVCLSPLMIHIPSVANRVPTAPPRPSPVPEPTVVKPDLRKWIMGPEGPRLNDGPARSWLRASQVASVNTVLQDTYREYLALEKQNREQSTKQGHVITVIRPLTTQLAPMEGRFWSRLDAIVDREQQNIFRLNLELYPREPPVGVPVAVRDLVQPGLLGWGKNGARIEIWWEGTWFRWKVRSASYEDSSTAPELPEQYRRFWKEPSQERPSTKSGP